MFFYFFGNRLRARGDKKIWGKKGIHRNLINALLRGRGRKTKPYCKGPPLGNVYVLNKKTRTGGKKGGPPTSNRQKWDIGERNNLTKERRIFTAGKTRRPRGRVTSNLLLRAAAPPARPGS